MNKDKVMLLGIGAMVVAVIAGLVIAGSHMDLSMPAAAAPSVQEPSVSRAEQAALDEGYTDVVETGTPFFGCSDSDSILNSESIDAKNSNGKVVHLTVCCGWFKGCTVRH